MKRHCEIVSALEDLQDGLKDRHRKKFARSILEGEEDESEKALAPRFRIDSITSTVQPQPPKSSMRVLLRNTRTMKFFRSADRWTRDPRQARDFHSGWGAAIYAFTLDPRHLEIHYEFDDARYDMDIAVLSHGAA